MYSFTIDARELLTSKSLTLLSVFGVSKVTILFAIAVSIVFLLRTTGGGGGSPSIPFALTLAQKEGFAEPDPSFDISGQDAAQKTSILATLSFFKNSSMENVYFEGIDKISPDDIDYGKQLNFVLKPLSVGMQNKDQITLGSFPAFVKTDSLLASIQNENNAVLVNAENVGGTMYSGPGAGAKPTANSVLSDVIDIAPVSYTHLTLPTICSV